MDYSNHELFTIFCVFGIFQIICLRIICVRNIFLLFICFWIICGLFETGII